MDCAKQSLKTGINYNFLPILGVMKSAAFLSLMSLNRVNRQPPGKVQSDDVKE